MLMNEFWNLVKVKNRLQRTTLHHNVSTVKRKSWSNEDDLRENVIRVERKLCLIFFLCSLMSPESKRIFKSFKQGKKRKVEN